MQEQFYRTGQAAKQLGISTYRVRALCESGAIADAELTDSGQWILPATAIQKLLRDGVPPTPKTINTAAPAISGSAAGRSKQNRSTTPLIAAPSEDAVDAAEDSFISERKLVTDTNKLARMKVRKEGLELQDWFDARDQAKLQRELEEDRRREASDHRQLEQHRAGLAAEERRRFHATWMAYALGLGKPWDSPGDYAALVKSEINAALSEVEPDEDDSIVRELVDAAIVCALSPWRVAEAKRLARQTGIESAISTLPLEMRWGADWSAHARKIALDAADSSRDDADASDIAAAAKAALHPLLAEYQHLSKIRDAARYVALPNGSHEDDQEAREAVTHALAALPVGASDRVIEQAKDTALAPVRERIAARDREARKDCLVAIALLEVFPYARRLIEEFDFEPGESVFDIDRRTRGIVEQTIRVEVDGSETEDHVRHRVHQIMKKAERCE